MKVKRIDTPGTIYRSCAREARDLATRLRIAGRPTCAEGIRELVQSWEARAAKYERGEGGG